MSEDEQAAVEAAADAVVIAVQAGDADRARAALMDSGTVDKSRWYQYVVSVLLERVRRNRDLGPDTDPDRVAAVLGPPLPDGPWLRSKVAAVTGRQMSADEARTTIGLGAAAAASAQHLITEYLLLGRDQSPAQQRRFLAALNGLMGASQQYVAVVVMLAKASGSGPEAP